ncbi:hypothetical protein IKE67_01530 [bacterium]|nr:hypothetical protein [bacterium]
MPGDDLKVTAQRVQVHQKQQDKDAEEKSRESDFDAVARALLQNYNGHKGSGEKIYIETADGKKTAKDVSVWMQNLDTNQDGVITADEVQRGGGDKFGILKMNADEKTRKKVSEDMEGEKLIGGLIGLGKGIGTNRLEWKFAKSYVIKYTNKEDLKGLFSNKKVRDYYNANYWGTDEKSLKKNETTREHMREVFQAHGFTEQDYKDMGFSADQIKFFMGK